MNDPVEPPKVPPPEPALVPPPAKDVAVQDGAGLSAEEQMERFEDALKESDWGHQPC